MEGDFRLENDEILKLKKSYEKCAEEITRSTYQYLKDLNDILGVGWKGRANEEFARVVSDYTDGSTEIANKLLTKRDVLVCAVTKILKAEEESGQKIRAQGGF
ncbi:MAG: hypothetical protein WC900_06305 [Oscillospiraceae bacterium]|jgi:uncharacterized protein YukE